MYQVRLNYDDLFLSQGLAMDGKTVQEQIRRSFHRTDNDKTDMVNNNMQK